MKAPSLAVRLVAEVVGTFGFFFLGFSGIAASIDHPGSIGSAGVAAGFGLGLGLMIAAFGHISGGHFNPAVTLGLAASRRFPPVEVLAYWAAQIVGGIIATLLARGAYSKLAAKAFVNHPAPGVSDGKAFILEAVATFLFLLVIVTVATDARAPWNGVMAPLAIGGFIFTAAVVIGPFTSGSFNPARSLAPALIEGDWNGIWIYLLGPLLGGVIGGALMLVLREADGAETA